VTAPADAPRTLGVVECFTAVVRQCPKAPARAVAEAALATVEREGAGAIAGQAFLVLAAIQGWQGERAGQVRRSLRAFLEAAEE
jgi:hypothetical protein